MVPFFKNKIILICLTGLLILPFLSFCTHHLYISGIRTEFILFGLTLAGVAVFQKHAMVVSLVGLLSILVFNYLFQPGFSFISHLFGTTNREGEWKTLLNLFGLLTGFAILASHFKESKIPEKMPAFLPDDWKGGLLLLFLIMVLSAFLDNIAAAMIGGAVALTVFKGKVHLGYLAAIVAASNAGGAGSVLGDTTTTLMWIDGVNPFHVFHAYIASAAAFLVFGVIGSVQQDRFQRIQKDAVPGVKPDFRKVFIIVFILAGAIITNWLFNFPALGVWIVIVTGSLFVKTTWKEIPKSIQGSIFLMALVTCASLMPVESLPAASWKSSFILGFVSSVFDNIPLTRLCLVQGGFDWGILAYAVGFGGSMIWFGSSAGVALSTMYPEAKSVVNYVKKGWHVSLAYVVGFFFLLLIMGWHPGGNHKNSIKQHKPVESILLQQECSSEQQTKQ
jgi:Na+/H+ antiporter NhaD/arsenite permease-like protein